MIEQRIFNNRYRLEHKLGEGGMATVFSGTDTLLRRRVAIKVLRDQYAADEEFVRRFYQEAESAAKLSHPNIVATYDVGREGDAYYIVMELIDGAPLAEIIAADGKLPEPVMIDYAAQVCNGLAYAHRQGLLHRDIKPANILVTRDDVVKLSDFGIARAVSQQTMAMTKPGLIMGSVYYVSPEQAQGKDLRESSDLYSVGVVLYQMLTGTLPFTGDSPVTVALKHIGDPVPIIDPHASGTSPALAAIVNKLLQKQPENRFQSASDVARALREARERPTEAAFTPQNDAPTQPFAAHALPPRRSPLPDRSARRTIDAGERPRRGVANLFVLLTVLVAALGVGYFAFGRGVPNFAATITLGDFTNLTDVAAQQQIVNAGLVAHIIQSPSDAVAANHVIRQNPAAGARVEKHSVVELIVSNGLPLVGLRDVRGYTVTDAQRDLVYEKFRVKIVRRFDAAPKDSVIDQHPKAGANVRQGSTIALIVSDGPRPLAMPNLVSMSIGDAQALAQKMGFALDVTERVSVPGVPGDVIAAQDVTAGTTLGPATVVHLTVSSGSDTPLTGVPDVHGKPFADASAALKAAGFSVNPSYVVRPGGSGNVVQEQPAAGASAPAGSAVTIVLEVPGEVPDTEGMTVDQARLTLTAAGYPVGATRTSSEGAGGRAIGTDPQAGTSLAPGSLVTLIVNGPTR